MPYDKEVHFGFVGPDKCFEFAARIGAKIFDYKNRDVTLDKFVKMNAGKQRFSNGRVSLQDVGLNPKLRVAFVNTIHAFGWQIGTIMNATLRDDNYIGVFSPWGNRAAGIWTLDCQYDPNENGEIPEDLTLGVNLSARYFPCILDMKDECGTMGSHITLNNEFFDQVNICKRELTKEIPELYDGEVYIRDIFY